MKRAELVTYAHGARRGPSVTGKESQLTMMEPRFFHKGGAPSQEDAFYDIDDFDDSLDNRETEAGKPLHGNVH
jgi:hypothetical protein